MRREDARAALLLAPYVLGVLILVVVPAAITFGLSFFRYDLLTDPVFVCFENFGDLLDDPVFHRALTNSLIFIAFAVPLRLIASVGAGAAAAPLVPRLRRVSHGGATSRRSCPTSPTRCCGCSSSTRSTAR